MKSSSVVPLAPGEPAPLAASATPSGNVLRSRAHLPQLDGLRALAIIAVLACHGSSALGPLASIAGRGWCGVDLFFVLSGFLITGILIDERNDERQLVNFYARRALRIWPLYYLYLALAVLLSSSVVQASAKSFEVFARPAESIGWGWYAVLAQNYFGYGGHCIKLLTVTWSLAVEEQYYLVWPAVVRRVSSSTLGKIACLVILVSPFARWYAANAGIDVYSAYVATPFRLDGLAAGALCAVLVRTKLLSRSQRRLGVTLLLIGAGLLLLQRPPVEVFAAPIAPSVYSGYALLFAGLLLLALTSTTLAKLLSAAPLRFVGKISYGLYLIHLPVFTILMRERIQSFTGLPALGVFVLAVVVSLGLASLSWTLFESRILKLKRYFAAEPRTATSDAQRPPRPISLA